MSATPTQPLNPPSTQPAPIAQGVDRFDDWARLVLAVLAIGSFDGFLWMWTTIRSVLPTNLMFYVLGSLTTIVMSTYSFWFGTSSGSVFKSRMMRE